LNDPLSTTALLVLRSRLAWGAGERFFGFGVLVSRFDLASSGGVEMGLKKVSNVAGVLTMRGNEEDMACMQRF